MLAAIPIFGLTYVVMAACRASVSTALMRRIIGASLMVAA